jgi:hypothetical protein
MNAAHHEELAELAQWASIALGVLALTRLVLPNRRAGLKRAAALSAPGMTLAVFSTTARTANLGGRIRHPEITPSPIEAPTDYAASSADADVDQ